MLPVHALALAIVAAFGWAILAGVVLLAVAVAFVVPAMGHAFYPKECCSSSDCAPLSSERVQVTAQGYIVDGRHRVPHGTARWSPDEHYHGCFPAPLAGKLGCFWAPRQAM